MRGFLSPHLEDRFEVLGYLRHRGGRHVREHVALEVDDAPLPVHPRQLAPDSGLYPLVVVAYHQTYPTQAPVDEPPKQRGIGLSLLPSRPPPLPGPPESPPCPLLRRPKAPC